IDKLKITSVSEAKRQIKAMAGGSRHQLTIQRGARLIERTATPVTGGPITYKIGVDPAANYEQLMLRQGWLGYSSPAPGAGAGNANMMRDAALKLFAQDPT